MTRPRVLLTNDDGWEAEGLRALGEVLSGLAELVVVAPERERSGVGCAVTLKEPIRAMAKEFPGAAEAWAVSGTPADCAKLAITTLFPERPFAVCFSGLNRGPNVGVNVFYSGTVGAVFEAAVNGVPGVALSKEKGERLSPGEACRLLEPLLAEIVERSLAGVPAGRGMNPGGHGGPPHQCRPAFPPWHVLNVNVPDLPAAEVRGVVLARQGRSGFREWYAPLERNKREEGGKPSPPGSRDFMLDGMMCVRDAAGDSDVEALRDGFIAASPLALDVNCERAGDLFGWVSRSRIVVGAP